jgi:NTE family protein
MAEFTLALGGGGVKGFAHLGVIRSLEKNGHTIKALAGTSAGAMVGALYAAGKPIDIVMKRLKQSDQDSWYQRQPGDGPSVLGLAGVMEILKELLGDCTFSQLKIPLVVTAVDLESGREVVLRDGRVLDAVRASIAVPGVFPPQDWMGRLLVDGGVVNPVPVAHARSLVPELPVVAVVLSPTPDHWEPESTTPRLFTTLPFINRIAGRLRFGQAFNIFLRSVDIGGIMLTDLRLRIEQPDVIIRPIVHHVGLLDRVDIEEIMQIGDIATLDALESLDQATRWQARLKRRVRRLVQD